MPNHPLFDGLAGTIPIPVSRHSENRLADLPRNAGVSVLADSAEAGLSLLEDRPRQTLLMFNHLEYDPETLPAEYERDRSAGKTITLPANTFPGDDPTQRPAGPWRYPARQFFANWLSDVQAASASAYGNRLLRIQPAARPVLPAVRLAASRTVADPLLRMSSAPLLPSRPLFTDLERRRTTS
jgi:Homoserine O-succinyltransferase